jgi:hypothetical protein
MNFRLTLASLALATVLTPLCAAAAPGELPACDMKDENDVEGTGGGVLEVHAVRFGFDPDPSIEGRYSLTLPALSKASPVAPDSIVVRVSHLEKGTPPSGETGFRKLIVTVPGIAGKGDKGSQPAVVMTSGPTMLGSRPVSPESDVLFMTNKAGHGAPTVEAMDLEKRLALPRSDIQIVLKDKSGAEMANYVLPAGALREMRDSLQAAYGKLVSGLEAGQCKAEMKLTGY